MPTDAQAAGLVGFLDSVDSAAGCRKSQRGCWAALGTLGLGWGLGEGSGISGERGGAHRRLLTDCGQVLKLGAHQVTP